MKITLYIPCHNAGRFISGCLEAILSQSLKPAEVVVINDGSTDRTVEIAKRFPVKVVHLVGHPGLAAARNAAIKAASHDYIASLDADCVTDRAWLEQLMKVMQDKDVAGVGGKLIEAHQDKLADKWRAIHMRQNWGANRIENPPFIFGCNTLFRKSALENIGLYDLRFRSNGEDVDISNRLKAKGYKLIYEPEAVVRHLKIDSVRSVLEADWNWGYITSGDTVKFESNSNIVYHSFCNAKYRLLQDVDARQYSLLPIDLMLFFFHTYWDICHAKRLGLTKTQSPGIRPRIKTLIDFQAHLEVLSARRFLQNPQSIDNAKSNHKPNC